VNEPALLQPLLQSAPGNDSGSPLRSRNSLVVLCAAGGTRNPNLLICREGRIPCRWRPALVRQWMLIGSTRSRMAVLLYGAAVQCSAQRASTLLP